jgi:alpha-mannosidase
MAYDSDSSYDSDFSGLNWAWRFGEITLAHDELSSDDDSNDDSSKSLRNDEWTNNFTTPRVCLNE